MKRFRYMKAVSVREAIGILAAEPGAALLAGGTNLVDLMKYDVSTPTVVVDINGLPLHDITEQPRWWSPIGSFGLQCRCRLRSTNYRAIPAAFKCNPCRCLRTASKHGNRGR
ncbi:MAG: putative xanthine dehydrogenase YagS FAD-binding subunit [Nitrospira sp.]|nr:putative xanthine dehydrogenase YagS FAD-binding subunit [Nitrospira sp.]